MKAVAALVGVASAQTAPGRAAAAASPRSEGSVRVTHHNASSAPWASFVDPPETIGKVDSSVTIVR